MIVSIHQPNYFPWLGYFYKIAISDKFIFLDDVQFTKGDYINRVKIYSPQNEEQWLTIPLNVKLGTNINEININSKWKKKHLKTIKQIYCKSKYFVEIYSDIETLFEINYNTLSELNINLINYILKKFELNVDCYLSSKINTNNTESDDRLIELIKHIGSNNYISGSGGFNYQSVEKFHNSGIEVLSYSINKNFKYDTKYKNTIGLSILDFIFNEGFNKEKLLDFGRLKS
jgi:hypothetical protein